MNIPYVFKKCTKCGEWLVASSVNFSKQKGGKYGLRAQCKKCCAEYDKVHSKKYREANKEAIKKRRRQHYEQNKETILERNRRYHEANKDKISEYHKQWHRQYYEANKEAIAKQGKQYYQDNKEVIAERQRQYYEQNKEAIAERTKQWYEQNKERIAEHSRKYHQSPQGQIVAFNSQCRRRAKLETQGRGITKEQWLECMSFFNWQCAYSGEYIGGEGKETRSLDHIVPLNKGGANEIWNVIPAYKSYNLSKQDKDLLEWYSKQPYFSQERLNKIYEWQEYAYNKWAIDTEAQ